MSRRHPRIRAQLTATVTLVETGGVLVCRTRDISHRGCFLDTAQVIAPGTRMAIALMDSQRGEVIEVDGNVTRCLPPGPNGLGRGVGLRFDVVPAGWTALVAFHQAAHPPRRRAATRLRVLVIGDRARQRGAMALYVTSGWDIRFATDVADAADALSGVKLHAVIVECDLDGELWQVMLGMALKLQPGARRIIRTALPEGGVLPASDRGSGPSLCHRIVDRSAGLDALLDALTADIPTDTSP